MPKNIVTKLAIIVSTAVSIIIATLIVWNINLTKNTSLEYIYESQKKQLTTIDLLLQSSNHNAKKGVEGLKAIIESLPDSEIDSEEKLINSVGIVANHIIQATNTTATYLGLSTGELIKSEQQGISKGVPYVIAGGRNDPSYNAASRPWYTGAMSSNKLFQTNVYESLLTKQLCITYSMPVFRNGKPLGVAAIDVYLGSLQAIFDEIAKTGSYIFALDSQHIPFVATDRSITMKESPLFKEIARIAESTESFEEFTVNDNGAKKLARCKVNRDSDFAPYILCSLRNVEDIEAPIMRMGYLQLAMGVLAVLCISCMIFFTLKYYLRPINKISNGLLDLFAFLNHEKKTVQPIQVNSHDELGNMAEAINANIEKTQKSLEQDSHAVS
ncbi:methyl-accepting chemotaxis protein, partial [Helicobacter aurati]